MSSPLDALRGLVNNRCMRAAQSELSGNAWHLLVLGLAVLLLSSCASRELRPESSWTFAAKREPLHHVFIKKQFDGGIAEGSGVIVHSSKKYGTYVLTCGHIACFSEDMPLEGSLKEISNYVGKDHACPKGTPVGIMIHARSARNGASWSEWKEFQGSVVYGKFTYKEWPFGDGMGELNEINTPDLNISILDAALIRVRTGNEPLESVALSKVVVDEPDWGSVQGISYFDYRPYTKKVYVLSDRLFTIDGKYCSGSGVYDRNRKLIGIQQSTVEDLTGRLKLGMRSISVSEINYFVPSAMIRREINSAGYGHLLK